MMRVVLTGGFFDPPHRGHISLFREAKALGDRLVVLVHRDECCNKKKGYCFMPLEDRKAILESIKYIDEVIVCPENCNLTMEPIIEMVKPNIYAKGGDRTPENMPEGEVETCRRLGVEIVYGVGGGKIQSSSWIIQKSLNVIKNKR
ncbi:MAG: adenylyltransferase/cytidyltransferase family protein [Candidatus Bathyarchaeia archaeon]